MTTPCSIGWGFTGQPASDGANALLFLGFTSPAVLTVSTTISGLTAGKRYRLSFDMAPQTCNTAACVGPGNPTDAKVNVGLAPSDATNTLVTASFPEPQTAPFLIPWIRKSIAFTPTASSVTLTLTEPTPTTGSLAFGVDNFLVEALPCASGINLELSVNSQTGTSTTDALLTLTSQDAVRVDVSKGLTHTVDDGATFITADGGAVIGACPGAGTPTAPSLTLPRGALLYTFDDVKYFPLPAAADRPFTIRGPSSTPTQLKFIINDCSDERTAKPGKNNFGSVTVLVRSLPTVSCENVFGGCTPTTATIPAAIPLFNSGLLFAPGESIVLTASGVWGTNQPAPALQAAFDADGFQGALPPGTCTPLLPSAKFGALIGTFDAVTFFLIGKGPTVVKGFGCGGTLQLAFNDCFANFAFHNGQLTLSFCSHDPAANVFNVDAGVCTRTLTFNTPVVTDKCPGSTFIPTPTTYAAGPSVANFIAIDDQNEFAQCFVAFTIKDNEAPKFTVCPSNIVLNNNPTQCGAIVGVAQGYLTPTATDNCPGAVTVTLFSAPTTAQGSLFPVGTTTVQWKATAGGLDSFCTFTVKVVDTQPPTFTACPSPQSYCAGSVQPFAGLSTVGDNCGPVPVVVTPIAPAGFNGLVPAGTIGVTLAAKDAAGNVAATPCTFSLTGVEENGDCNVGKKCIATQCVSGCIPGVVVTSLLPVPLFPNCPVGATFAYQYNAFSKLCTRITRSSLLEFQYVDIGPWTIVGAADPATLAAVAAFVGKFKLTTTGLPNGATPAVRTFTQVSGGTRSIELKTPAAVLTSTSVCSLKFNGADRKRVAGQLVLGGGAAPFPAPIPVGP